MHIWRNVESVLANLVRVAKSAEHKVASGAEHFASLLTALSAALLAVENLLAASSSDETETPPRA